MGLLPHVPVTSHLDSTRNFEVLGELLPESEDELKATKEALEALPKLARGVASVTFTASQKATAKEVTHGLGTTPVAVLLTLEGGEGGTSYSFDASELTATKFTINGFIGAETTATLSVFWLAIA